MKNLKLTLGTALLGTALLTSALMADPLGTYSKCVGCHGVTGEKQALGKSAMITGQDSAKTVEQLTAYRAGELNLHGMGGLMKAQMRDITDEQIKEIADYLEGNAPSTK